MDTIIYIRFLVSALYAAASLSYLSLLKRQGRGTAWPSGLLLAALLTHLGELLVRGADAGTAGGAPFVGLSGFVSLFAFLVGVIYVFLEHRYKVHTLGAFHLPVILALQTTAAVMWRPISEIPKLKTGHLFVLHVVPNAIAYGAFTVSAIAAVAFLLLDRELHKKRFGILMRGLPNLDLVEAVNASGASIGLVLLTLGAVVGMIMGYREWGVDYQWDLKNWVTFLIIIVYAVQLALRQFMGFSGRRSVVLSLVGFAMVVGCFTVINLYFSKLHSVM
jgi:ABC-type transport system involved in cytochrome c biogenesis permease subunit